MFTITKSFDFEYAHRVYSQDIQSDLACEKAENTCRHIHGHSGKLTVTLSSAFTDRRGFVIDYKEMGFIKAMVKDLLDHKTILSVRDPLWAAFEESWNLNIKNSDYTSMIKLVSNKLIRIGCLNEFVEGITLVDIIPTSESLAELFFNIIEKKLIDLGLEGKVYVEEVSWSETSSSTATFKRI